MSVIYGNWKIETKPNEWGYFEAINIKDCDAFIIRGKTLDIVRTEIDEVE